MQFRMAVALLLAVLASCGGPQNGWNEDSQGDWEFRQGRIPRRPIVVILGNSIIIGWNPEIGEQIEVDLPDWEGPGNNPPFPFASDCPKAIDCPDDPCIYTVSTDTLSVADLKDHINNTCLSGTRSCTYTATGTVLASTDRCACALTIDLRREDGESEMSFTLEGCGDSQDVATLLPPNVVE